MAEPSTLARPYAEAVFQLADASGKLGEWSDTLANLAAISTDPRVAAAIVNPELSSSKVADIFIDVLAGKLSPEAENLVRVLAVNRRLQLLPEISRQFEA